MVLKTLIAGDIEFNRLIRDKKIKQINGRWYLWNLVKELNTRIKPEPARPFVIGIIGSGGVGKSTFCPAFADYVEGVVIAEDAYHKHDRPWRRQILHTTHNVLDTKNYDEFEWDLEHLKINYNLQLSTSTYSLPIYNPKTGLALDGGKRIQVMSRQIVIVEATTTRALEVAKPDVTLFMHMDFNDRYRMKKLRKDATIRLLPGEDFFNHLVERQTIEYIPYTLPAMKNANYIIHNKPSSSGKSCAYDLWQKV